MSARTTSKDRENPEMGKRLRTKREEMHLSQKELAARIGITPGAYQNYEYGKEISSGRLVQICAILECSPNWLLGYHDKGKQLAPDSLLLKQLKDAFDILNDHGKQEAVKRVKELGNTAEYVVGENQDACASA